MMRKPLATMYNPKNAAQNIKQGRIYTNKNAAESKIKCNVLMSEISQVFLAQYLNLSILAGFGPIIIDFSSHY